MTEQTIDKPMMASELIAALSNPKRNVLLLSLASLSTPHSLTTQKTSPTIPLA